MYRGKNPERPLRSLPPTYTDVGAPFADPDSADPAVLYAANDAMRAALDEDLDVSPAMQLVVEAS